MQNKVNPIISIIIPAYNASAFIKKAINSYLNQSYKYIEVLVVDDGSSDNTASICEKISDKDTRVRAFHRNRGGVSRARNYGIQQATGDFIIFLDADDWLDPDIISKVVNRYEPDKINIFGFKVIRNDGTTTEELDVPDIDRNELIANAIYIKKERYNLGEFFRAACGKIFDLEQIKKNNCLFPEDLRMGEDVIFLMQYLETINGVNLISDSGYNYNRMVSSTVNSFMSEFYDQCELQYALIKSFLQENNVDYSDNVKASLNNFCLWMFVDLFDNGLCGVPNRKVKIKNAFHDSERWIDEHFDDFKKTVTDKDMISPRYAMLYDFFHSKDNRFPSSNRVVNKYLRYKIKRKIKPK